MRVAQVNLSLTSVYDTCAAGHRVVFDFDSNKRTGERTCFKLRNRVWELEVKTIPNGGNRGHPDKDARAECGGVASFRGAGTLAVSPIESPVGSGPVRNDSEREG